MRYILMLLVLIAFEVHAYDVVLTDGKVIKGTIIRETSDKIILKDSSGMFRSLNKTEVDLEKTMKANNGKAPGEDKASKEDKTISPVKEVTEEDFKKLREKYDWGSDTEEVEKAQETGQKEEKKRVDDIKKQKKEAEDEEKKKIEDYAERIALIRRDELSAIQGCGTALLKTGVLVTDTRGNITNYLANASSELPPVCIEFLELEQEVQDAKEEARRDGVPLGYLDQW